MDYSKIVSSAFAWVSYKRVFWFLLFFWVCLPAMVFVPRLLETGFYAKPVFLVVNLLYLALYLAVIAGLVSLIQFCLLSKHLHSEELSIRKLLDLFFLVVIEFFYVLVWGTYASFRRIQLLLLILVVSLFYYFSVSASAFVLGLFYLAFLAYLILVIYNSIRVFFATTLFMEKKVSPVEAIKKTIFLTHNRILEIFFSIVLVFVLVSIVFSFVVLCLGFVASIVLGYFFNNSLAVYLGFSIAFVFSLAPALISYQSAMTEIYSQLVVRVEAASSIKRILAHKILNPKKKKSIVRVAKKKKR